MNETNTEIFFEIKTTDVQKVNAMMKKMINALTINELDLIIQAKVTQVVAEVEVTYDEFEKNGQE